MNSDFEMTGISNTYDVIIAGAGPAGTSAAIHLAKANLRVLLIEQKQFPRPKLCGEFISPECFSHFENLGVAGAMMSSNPAKISRTVFYSSRGHGISVPSDWFGSGAALGLSRAAMDNNLLERAQFLGVDVLQGATVTNVIEEEHRVCGVRVKSGIGDNEVRALVTIDATGRSRFLTRRLQQNHDESKGHVRRGLVAFKAHLTNAEPAPDVCEIYSYRGGYGGLSSVENGISNLCFIVAAKDVRRSHSNADVVMHETVMRNQRAARTLRNARRCSEWLSVSLEGFGTGEPAPKQGLLAIGDSASFIDPFTGSGMLMALESGQLAASVIVGHIDELSNAVGLKELRRDYVDQYRRRFASRLRISGVLRRTAFNPRLAEMTIVACSLSEWLRNRLARATRSTTHGSQSTIQPT
jgi:flavin-dependent dehydrogenase